MLFQLKIDRLVLVISLSNREHMHNHTDLKSAQEAVEKMLAKRDEWGTVCA